jgi:hypothetical protein
MGSEIGVGHTLAEPEGPHERVLQPLKSSRLACSRETDPGVSHKDVSSSLVASVLYEDEGPGRDT